MPGARGELGESGAVYSVLNSLCLSTSKGHFRVFVCMGESEREKPVRNIVAFLTCLVSENLK